MSKVNYYYFYFFVVQRVKKKKSFDYLHFTHQPVTGLVNTTKDSKCQTSALVALMVKRQP